MAGEGSGLRGNQQRQNRRSRKATQGIVEREKKRSVRAAQSEDVMRKLHNSKFERAIPIDATIVVFVGRRRAETVCRLVYFRLPRPVPLSNSGRLVCPRFSTTLRPLCLVLP
jgi:hypothetical protein